MAKEIEEIEADRERTYACRDLTGEIIIVLTEDGVEGIPQKYPLPEGVSHQSGSDEVHVSHCALGANGYILITPESGENRVLLRYEWVSYIYNDEFYWVRGSGITSDAQRPQQVRPRQRVHV